MQTANFLEMQSDIRRDTVMLTSLFEDHFVKRMIGRQTAENVER